MKYIRKETKDTNTEIKTIQVNDKKYTVNADQALRQIVQRILEKSKYIKRFTNDADWQKQYIVDKVSWVFDYTIHEIYVDENANVIVIIDVIINNKPVNLEINLVTGKVRLTDNGLNTYNYLVLQQNAAKKNEKTELEGEQ